MLAGADIFCQPNVQPEPFGVAIIEALYAGVPVVATDMGGPQEIISNSGAGVLVSPRRPDELANALRQLVMDPDRRQLMGEAGPGRARALSDPGARIQQLHDLLASCIARRGHDA